MVETIDFIDASRMIFLSGGVRKKWRFDIIMEIQECLPHRIVIIANALCPKSSSPRQQTGKDGFVKSNRLELEG
jgi:hypothetical protein